MAVRARGSLRRWYAINPVGTGPRNPRLMAPGMGALMTTNGQPLCMSYSLELPFIFYKIMAFGPGAKGNGEPPLPQTMCCAFWQLLSISPITIFRYSVQQSSQHPSHLLRLLMIAKTYTWCIFMGKNCFGFSSNRLTKAWHLLAFTCLVLVLHFLHTSGWAEIESLTTLGCVLIHSWQWQELLTCESSQASSLTGLTKRKLFLSTPVLFCLYSLYLPKENSTFAIS